MESKKLSKELVQMYIDTYDALQDRACDVVSLLIRAKKMVADNFEEIYEICEDKVIVRVYDRGDYETRGFPIEYLYDDIELNKLEEEIKILEEEKRQKELEDKAYYAQLEKEDELRLLRKLQRKYPEGK